MSAIEKNHRTPVQSTKPEVRKCGIGMIKKTKEEKEPEPTKPNVEIKETRGKGKGLYATKFVEAVSFVISFITNRTSEEEMVKRFEMYGSKVVPTYVLDSGNHTVFMYCL